MNGQGSWWREPLLHFAALGAVIFAVGAFRASARPDAVVIHADALIARHTRRFGTAPDAATLAELVDRATEEALLIREAEALGLGDDDVIIRRRLIQKMNLVIEEVVHPRPPSDAVLRRFLVDNAATFARPEQRVVRHVFIRRSPQASARAAEALAAVQGGADPKGVGDPFAKGRRFGPTSMADLARILGKGVAEAAFALDDDAWHGPFESPYGLHLMRIEGGQSGGPADLDDVREAVTRAWTEAETKRRRAAAIDVLRGKYRVQVRGLP